jgi:serine/threonine protein kinase
LDSKLRLRIALEIAKIFEYLHDMDPPVIHGHLTPNNILFTKDFKVKITDLHLSSLKKLAHLKFNYVNKSAYSAPELLSQRSGVIKSATKQSDAYSYGIILWELFTEKFPFEGLSLKETTQRVVEEKSRPKVPDNCSTDIAQIIRSCWQEEAEKRPSFKTVRLILENFHDF